MSKRFSGNTKSGYVQKGVVSKINSGLPNRKPKRVRHKVIIEEKTLLDYIIDFIIQFFNF